MHFYIDVHPISLSPLLNCQTFPQTFINSTYPPGHSRGKSGYTTSPCGLGMLIFPNIFM